MHENGGEIAVSRCESNYTVFFLFRVFLLFITYLLACDQFLLLLVLLLFFHQTSLASKFLRRTRLNRYSWHVLLFFMCRLSRDLTQTIHLVCFCVFTFGSSLQALHQLCKSRCYTLIFIHVFKKLLDVLPVLVIHTR